MFKIELQTLRKRIRYDVILLTIMYTAMIPWSVLSDPRMRSLNSPGKKKKPTKKKPTGKFIPCLSLKLKFTPNNLCHKDT